LVEKNTSGKIKHAQHYTENLCSSATCLHPPMISGRKFDNNKKITIFDLKALSLSPNPCTPKCTLTQRIKCSECYLFLFFFLCDTLTGNSLLLSAARSAALCSTSVLHTIAALSLQRSSLLELHFCSPWLSL
jgi:hypothetical protein